MSDLELSEQFTGSDIILYADAQAYESFDFKIMNDTLNELRINSFNFLNDAQKNLISYSRFDLTMSDLREVRTSIGAAIGSRKFIGILDGAFLPGARSLEFKKSAFYNTELGISNIASNPELFTHVFLVFINGKFYDNIKIYCDGASTRLVFNTTNTLNATGIPIDHFNGLVAGNCDITVYFVPNCAFGVYTTNINVLLKYNHQLSLNRFNIINSLDTESHYITFVNANDFLFSGVITDTTTSAGLLKFLNQNTADYQSKFVHLNIFGFKNLFDQIDIAGTNRFFTIPIQDMPLPVENIMVFRNVAGRKYFAHEIRLKLYYPNYYEVLNNTNNDDLTIYVFYFKDTTISGFPKYKNMLETYTTTMSVGVSDYVNGTLPSAVRDYAPSTNVYDIRDFEASSYTPYHLAYKLNKLRQWIANNPDEMRIYLTKQMEQSNAFYLDLSLMNLSLKYRLNNYSEAEFIVDRVVFSEPQYLFTVKRSHSDSDSYYRFFMDGLLMNPKYLCKDNFFEFYYIPVSKINPTGIMEIEKFDAFSFQTDLIFSAVNEIQTINFTTALNLQANNIFIINSSTKEFISESAYEIIITLAEIDVTLPQESFKKIPTTFKVKLLDASLVNIPLTLYGKEYFFLATKNVLTEADIPEVYSFIVNGEFDSEMVRVFRNGRLLPSTLVGTIPSNNLIDISVISPLIDKVIGDTYVIDYTPYSYKTIFSEDVMSNRGFVDLRNIINKPFDLKWYDVYLNGRKLNRTNITVVSPGIIFIKNVSSLKHLYIIEKNRGGEFFATTSQQDIIGSLFDSESNFRDTLLNAAATILDTEADIITSIISMYGLELSLLLSEYFNILSNRYINPDLEQITSAMRTRYPNVIGSTQAVIMNPDISYSAINKVMVFPDIV